VDEHGRGALHARLASELTAARPARVHVAAAPAGRLDVTVVGFDFFSAFAMLCGVLAARGLEIESGRASTQAPREAPRAVTRPRHRRGERPRGEQAALFPSARVIVDEFRVVPRGPAASLDADELSRQLESDLFELLPLVAEGRIDEARDRLGRRLAERFSGVETPAGALAPLSIEFDNASDPQWTRMEVRGRDTPGFLYALATALALRNLYVQQVEIASVGAFVRDTFLIASRDGRKLEDEAELQRLQVAVALIKQFAHLLPLAPDPARALRSFGQLVDQVLSAEAQALERLASPEGLRELARLLGASSFLWEDFLRLQAEHLLPVLDGWKDRPLRGRDELLADLQGRLAAGGFDEQKCVLNAFKDEEMLLADLRHLALPQVDLVAFSRAITDLAEAVVEAALHACRAEVARARGLSAAELERLGPLAALGLGKFGGREMGYASDIELLFVYRPEEASPGPQTDAGQFYEQVVRELLSFIAARQEGIFHVDLRLRPHGAKGPLASPVAALGDYYRPGGGAAPFERQALVKLRPVAGDPALGREVLAVRDAFVWSDEPWDRANALHLRERQCRELVPAGRFNVKYSPGALVEVEYAVQYLQLEHGRARPELRSPTTLEALDRLGAAGLVTPAERDALRAAYLFWRAVADALRMVRGHAQDLLLPEPDSEELRFLARRMGYAGEDWREAGRAFLADLDRHREAVGRIFTERFRR
jgi:[glutamine synthetase] adenylyltransferase / [glutamine synthetase]-adenylyl-L-tyrosine phosphorylase